MKPNEITAGSCDYLRRSHSKPVTDKPGGGATQGSRNNNISDHPKKSIIFLMTARKHIWNPDWTKMV